MKEHLKMLKSNEQRAPSNKQPDQMDKEFYVCNESKSISKFVALISVFES